MTPILNIAVVDMSNRGDVQRALPTIVRSLSRQLERDFQPVWGRPLCTISIHHKAPDDGSSLMGIFDTQDQPGVLGFHDDKDGIPFSRVFVDTIMSMGGSIVDGPTSLSATLSHELLEMILDPSANLWAADQEGKKLYALEACDAVEGNAYAIDGVTVSDFLYPAFFDYQSPSNFRLNHVSDKAPPGPLKQRDDGYQLVWDIAKNQVDMIGFSRRRSIRRKLIRGMRIG